MSDPEYCYPPDHTVLRNKWGLKDAEFLNEIERELVATRTTRGMPEGDFDLKHLQAMHFRMFQDIYDWAGEIRTVEINKGGDQFQFRRFIETGMDDVHRRVVAADYLKGSTPDAFSETAGELIGDINHIHPFREGNGRTQMQYLKQLSEKAGHDIDLKSIDRDAWITASRQSHQADYTGLQTCIRGALKTEPLHSPNIDQKDYAKSLRQAQSETRDMQKTREQDIE
ncbi:Fic/DOC family protein [Halocynthiibacter styelae]|uniref:protein adenylyltransferase n=1 Tax=Halocynthiibacter styelae TaxID=2761955 RepID=A0A8J7IKZ6_9RHOB|nr:Fic family protein [Paenihalocynthiibacter styelae]MBI1492016.1 Fic family protein [Paenihalocynthiibacter styelae]